MGNSVISWPHSRSIVGEPTIPLTSGYYITANGQLIKQRKPDTFEQATRMQTIRELACRLLRRGEIGALPAILNARILQAAVIAIKGPVSIETTGAIRAIDYVTNECCVDFQDNGVFWLPKTDLRLLGAAIEMVNEADNIFLALILKPITTAG